MQVADAVIVVTGGGSGIGAGLVRRFAADGAAAVIAADRNVEGARRLADELGPRVTAAAVDVTDEAQLVALVARTVAAHGRIDLFCSNAGIPTGVGLEGGADADRAWQQAWEVHVLAHVYAARAVLPGMVAAGRGYLLNTASAAGLLSSPGDAPYTASKHAAVAFAEWLAYTYRDRGIGVSVLCPMGVDTPLLMDGLNAGEPAARAVAASAEIIGVEAVVDAVVAALATETFLILPHPQVGRFWSGKTADIDRWLAGMAVLAGRAGTTGPTGTSGPD